MQCLSGNPERGGRCRLISAVPSQLFYDESALELLHLLRQPARQFVILDRAAYLRQPVTQ